MHTVAKIIYLSILMSNASFAYNWAIWPGAQEGQQGTMQSAESRYGSSSSQFSPPIQGGSPSLTPSENSQWSSAPYNGESSFTSSQAISPLQSSTNPNLANQYQQPGGQPSIPFDTAQSYNNQQSSQFSNNYNPSLQQPQSNNLSQYPSDPAAPQQPYSSPQKNQSPLQQSPNSPVPLQNQQQFPAIGQMALSGLAALSGLSSKSNQETISDMTFNTNNRGRNFLPTSNRIVTKNFKCTKSAERCEQEWDELIQSIESNPQFQIIKKRLSCVPSTTDSE
ncbi:MAG: hypothetical protein K0M45_06025 [Candidatus Paracaedibacteraceae bacterium]|nr:hypothetical protein [Candidatus Paracaedibacteraceae bacterium]